MAIRSFRSKAAEDFFYDGTIGKGVAWAAVAKVAARKLDMLAAAKDLRDLRAPPSNRLEPLKGDLHGLWSIGINDQFRVVFRWVNGGAEYVDITDYH